MTFSMESNLTKEILAALTAGRLKVEKQKSDSPETTASTLSSQSRSSSAMSLTESEKILLNLEMIQRQQEEDHRESMSRLSSKSEIDRLKKKLTPDQIRELNHNLAIADLEMQKWGLSDPIRIPCENNAQECGSKIAKSNSTDTRREQTPKKYEPWIWTQYKKRMKSDTAQ